MTPKIVSVGDNVVDCYQAQGLMFAGGNTLNVSVFAARSGGTASYLGAISGDSAGRHILSALTAEDVDLSRLRVVDGTTAYCIVGHREGDRVFLASDLGVSRFDLTAADLDFVGRQDVAHIGQSSGLDSALKEVASRTRLSYDFSTRRDEDHLRRVAPLCYLASFSGGDLAEADARQLAERAVQLGAEWALVTRGPEGAVLAGASGTRIASAAPADVTDTLGAGDTFIARSLVGLLRRESPDALLADAARRAAETCARLGAFGHGAPISDTILSAHPEIIPTAQEGATHD
jgi:fructoselysine 6-kinase